MEGEEKNDYDQVIGNWIEKCRNENIYKVLDGDEKIKKQKNNT